MRLSYELIAPTSDYTKGLISNIQVIDGTPNYTFKVEYEGAFYTTNTLNQIEGYAGYYTITVVDSLGNTCEEVIYLEGKEDCNCGSILYGDVANMQSYTISFAPAYEGWTSFHSYNNVVLTSANTFYHLNNFRELWKMNEGDRGNYFGTSYSSYIDYVQLEKGVSNVDSILILSEVYDDRGVQLVEDSVDYITVNNQNQSTGKIKIYRKDEDVTQTSGNMRYIEGYYSYNDLRDVAKLKQKFKDHILKDFNITQSAIDKNRPSQQKGRLTSTYSIARLEFVNQWNKLFILNDVLIKTTQSSR